MEQNWQSSSKPLDLRSTDFLQSCQSNSKEERIIFSTNGSRTAGYPHLKLIQSSGFRWGRFWLPKGREHLAISRDDFGCHRWGRSFWPLVGRGRRCCAISNDAYATLAAKNDPDQCVNGAEDEIPPFKPLPYIQKPTKNGLQT